MKIKIEIDEGLPEDEVLIRCRGLTEHISDVQKDTMSSYPLSDQHLAEIRLLQRKYRVLPDLG